MVQELGSIIQELRVSVNQATSRETSPVDSLAAMWTIGEILRRHSINQPHSFGVQLQKATGGIVKRPLIFRAAKVRDIWPDRESLLRECSGLKSQHNVVEMFPYLDPGRRSQYDVPESELSALRSAMVRLSSSEFTPLLKSFKRAHPHARLGRALDRAQHLPSMSGFADELRNSRIALLQALESGVLTESGIATHALADRLRFAAGALASMTDGAPKLDHAVLRAIDASLAGSGVLTNLDKRRRLWRLFSRGQIMELAEMVLACSGATEREEFLRNRRVASALSSDTVRRDR